ncbi:MAG: glutamate-5-semialdehyde dehydrogenase, partial [Desulfovibrio sp.]|nr:glutamate-5-semialdehyde dehydrogenase [Desulfovibrio sp.]
PIGVIAMIYEARPAVTVEAAILALKAGNAIILRGGREVSQTNGALVTILGDALAIAGLPRACAQQAPPGGHEVVEELCRQGKYIDLMIPRGGESLIRAVVKAAEMPVLMHYKGVCHAYIDADANLEQAVRIVENSKTQRPAVCNALECVLVHRDVAGRFLPMLARQLAPYHVEFRADAAAMPLLGPGAVPVRPDDLGREFMSQILVALVVPDMDAAIRHIDQYGSRHTDIICTENYGNAMRFLREVDASMVAVNASTRFNDGGQLGLGAEIGISTTKLHAYGPMGLRELTTTKYVVLGSGQVRE